MGINSVGTESVYQTGQAGRTECLASVSQEGLTREILARHNCLHLAWLFTFQHVQSTWYTSRDAKSWDTRKTFFSLQMLESSHHSFYHTTLTMKSHNTYKVQLIEYNYNRIWHGIKTNKTFSCKEQLYSPKEIGIMIILWYILKHISQRSIKLYGRIKDKSQEHKWSSWEEMVDNCNIKFFLFFIFYK